MPYPSRLVRLWAIVTGCLFLAGVAWDWTVNADRSLAADSCRLVTGRTRGSAPLAAIHVAGAALGGAMMVGLFAWAVCVPVYAAVTRLIGKPDGRIAADYDDPHPTA